jgi:urease accessory protein
MIRATSVIRAGRWSGAASDHVVLGYDDRHRRRLAMQGARGLTFLLDLDETTVLHHGDGLVLADGRMVEVRARPEPLLVVRARDPHHLARLAWHLGNRHVPAAIDADRILIRPDHVIASMLVGLGAEVTAEEAPFDPEPGAYAHSGAHLPHDASGPDPHGHS